MSPRQSETLLEMMKKEVDISWQGKGHNGFVLVGSINQLEIAHRYVQEYFLQRPYLLFKEERMVQGKDAMKTLQNSAENFEQAKKDSREKVEECTFEAEPTFIKLFKRVHKEKLEKIERESHLKIVWAENETRVNIKPTPLTKETHYQEGCNAFIDLYQTVHQSMKRQVVDVKDIHNDGKIKDSIAFVESKHPVVIEKVEGQLIVYGEEIHLKSSVKALKKMLGMSKIRGDNPRHGQRNIRHSSHHHEQPLPKILQQTLKNNVRLSLYQGDITDEQVYAIVNPANAWLQHSQGVGGAIVKKGGSQIIHDSQYVMSHRIVPLQPGEAVYTRGGQMASHYIIHTVGPDWSAYADKSVAVIVLRKACINCLRLAVQLQLSSIALPAISSGNCGMPKEVCAGAIFRAIEEFSTSIDAECSTLRDIRVVIIDTETTEVFRREFINRYYSEQKSQNQMATQRGPSSEEGESPFSTNRGRGDPGIDDELPNVKLKSTRDNFTGSIGRQHGDDSHQRVEEQHQQTFEESNLKAAKWPLAESVEAQNVGSGMNVTRHKDEGRDTNERYEKTARSSVKSVPGRGRGDPGIDDELPNVKLKSTRDNFTGSIGRQHGDDSHQRVEEQHQQTFEESNLKAAKWPLAESVEAQNVGSGMNVTRHKDEGRDTNERYEKTARSSVKSVPGRGVLAPSFSRKGEGVTKGATVGRVMSHKPTRAIKHPPGLSATEDGLNIAKKLMGVENNEQFTNEEEDKPPDKSEEGNELVYPYNDLIEPSASGPVHSNSSAPKTEETEREIQMPLEITPDPTNASASGKGNAPNDVPSSAAGTTQGPGQNTI